VNDRVLIHVEAAPFGGGFTLYVAQSTAQGLDVIDLGNVARHSVPENTQIPPGSVLTLSDSAARQLMDQLWVAGVRPTKVIDEQSRAGAMQAHIDDLRSVVQQALPVAIGAKS